MTGTLRLSDVYKNKQASPALLALLMEREGNVNISHRRMPTLTEHRKFILSKPYKTWDLIMSGQEIVGAVYLTHQSEIGLFIFKKFRENGFGKKALALLMKKHAGSVRFLANINPRNRRSIRFFERLGFRHIQNTYELRKG